MSFSTPAAAERPRAIERAFPADVATAVTALDAAIHNRKGSGLRAALTLETANYRLRGDDWRDPFMIG